MDTEKLNGIVAKYEELTKLVADPEIIADNKEWTKLVKEHSSLEPVVTAYGRLKSADKEIAELTEMAHSEPDAEMRELAEAELTDKKKEKAELENELKILLLPVDPNDDKNVIMEIRAGAGGDEAALFAAELMRMYKMYAEKLRFKVEDVDINETELGGVKEAVFSLTGDSVFARLKFESGVHRVQRVPDTESQGRIHTSTVTVAVLPEVEDVVVEINEKDLKIDTYRSGGAGGQHVNKTDSAVRITHLPTGIVVQCQNERSQIQNRETAMKMLTSKLVELRERENLEKANSIKGEIKKIEWGSQIRSYVFQPYTMVKDHRTGYETGDVYAVMDGEISEFIYDYLRKS